MGTVFESLDFTSLVTVAQNVITAVLPVLITITGGWVGLRLVKKGINTAGR